MMMMMMMMRSFMFCNVNKLTRVIEYSKRRRGRRLWRNINICRVLGGKSEENRPLGRPRQRVG
jgi:hypothetical protein